MVLVYDSPRWTTDMDFAYAPFGNSSDGTEDSLKSNFHDGLARSAARLCFTNLVTGTMFRPDPCAQFHLWAQYPAFSPVPLYHPMAFWPCITPAWHHLPPRGCPPAGFTGLSKEGWPGWIEWLTLRHSASQFWNPFQQVQGSGNPCIQ